MPKEEKILDVKINTGFNWESLLAYIDKYLSKKADNTYICTTNAEFIMDAQTDPEFKAIINNSLLSIPDGVGVLQALKYNNYLRLLDRKDIFYPLKALYFGIYIGLRCLAGRESANLPLDGVTLFDKMCELAAKKGYSVFILGGRLRDSKGNVINAEVSLSKLTSEIISKKYPNIRIIGYTSDFNRYEGDDVATLDYIHQCMTRASVNRLDLLFVAYNHPYQEKWIIRNMHKIPVTLSVGVGGTFDLITGKLKTPPPIIRKTGLIWLYKLFIQPWRYKRVFKAFPMFPIRVFFHSYSHKNK